MKTLSIAVACAMLAASVNGASARLSTGDRSLTTEPQWSTIVPIRPDVRGEPSCPSNFVIRGKVCMSIFASPRALRYSAGDRETARPWINSRREVQCPSNFVLHRKTCISLYY